MKKVGFFLIFTLLVIQPSLALNVNWNVLDQFLAPSSETLILLSLTNELPKTAKKIEIFAYPETCLNVEPNYVNLGSLESGNSYQTSFRVILNECPYSTKLIKFVIKYYTDSEEKELNLNIPLSVIAYPILEIENVSYSKEFIEPGDSVSLKFVLSNKGSGDAKNIKIVLNQTFVIAPVNEIFVKDLKSGESKIIEFQLTVKPELKVGVYTLPLTIVYQDKFEKQDFIDTKLIRLKLYSNFTFFASVERQDLIKAGSDGYVEIKIANLGKQDAKSVFLKFIQDSLRVKPSQIYIGDLDARDFYAESILVKAPPKAGDYTLRAILYYKDLYGNLHEKMLEFKIEVSRKEEISFNKFILVLAPLAVILLLFLFIRKI